MLNMRNIRAEYDRKGIKGKAGKQMLQKIPPLCVATCSRSGVKPAAGGVEIEIMLSIHLSCASFPPEQSRS